MCFLAQLKKNLSKTVLYFSYIFISGIFKYILQLTKYFPSVRNSWLTAYSPACPWSFFTILALLLTPHYFLLLLNKVLCIICVQRGGGSDERATKRKIVRQKSNKNEAKIDQSS